MLCIVANFRNRCGSKTDVPSGARRNVISTWPSRAAALDRPLLCTISIISSRGSCTRSTTTSHRSTPPVRLLWLPRLLACTLRRHLLTAVTPARLPEARPTVQRPSLLATRRGTRHRNFTGITSSVRRHRRRRRRLQRQPRRSPGVHSVRYRRSSRQPVQRVLNISISRRLLPAAAVLQSSELRRRPLPAAMVCRPCRLALPPPRQPGYNSPTAGRRRSPEVHRVRSPPQPLLPPAAPLEAAFRQQQPPPAICTAPRRLVVVRQSPTSTAQVWRR
jgi:hypothetical protein